MGRKAKKSEARAGVVVEGPREKPVRIGDAVEALEMDMRIMLTICRGVGRMLNEDSSDVNNDDYAWALCEQHDRVDRSFRAFFKILDEPGVWDAIRAARGSVEDLPIVPKFTPAAEAA